MKFKSVLDVNQYFEKHNIIYNIQNKYLKTKEV